MTKFSLSEKLAMKLAPAILNLLLKTLRIRILEPNLQPSPSQPRVLAFWHGKLIMTLLLHQQQGLVVMVSQHKDGEMIDRVVKKMGLDSVRGSSTRGGKRAYVGLLEKVRNGYSAGITPDGPTGPIHKMKFGVLRLSQETDAHIHLYNWYAEKKWVFKSWDKFELPKPFARVVVGYSDIPPINKKAELEAEALRLENEMHLLEKKCHDAFKNR